MPVVCGGIEEPEKDMKKPTKKQQQRDANLHIARILFFDLMDGRDNEVQEDVQWRTIDVHLTRAGQSREALKPQSLDTNS